MSELSVEHDPTRDRFTVTVDDEVAYLHYQRNHGGQRFHIRSTYVPPSLRGKDIGRKLVLHALDYAKGKGLEVKSSCWYATKVMQER